MLQSVHSLRKYIFTHYLFIKYYQEYIFCKTVHGINFMERENEDIEDVMFSVLRISTIGEMKSTKVQTLGELRTANGWAGLLAFTCGLPLVLYIVRGESDTG